MCANMKTFILSERALETVKGQMLNESYGDKIALVKKFLDRNYMRGYLEKSNPGGTKGNIGVFIQLNNGLPTDSSVWLDDVVDALEHEANYHKLIANELERKGLFLQIAKDWYNRSPKLKLGNLTSYDFLRNIKGS
jgi:hypothetical protein